MRFRRRMIKRKSIAKVFCSLVLLYFCYLLGVFTHLMEKDFRSFSSSNSAEIPEFPNKNFDINNLNYKFLYESKETCETKKNKLVILVKSKLSNFEQRSSIRSTWGDKKNDNLLISLVFLLGIPSPDEYPDINNEHHQIENKMNLNDNKNSRELFSSETMNLNEKLKAENENYNDIVQQNFYDTYYNNTLKAIMGLQWIDRYCSDAGYYLFIDDDYYLNPKMLLKYLKENLD